MNPVDWYFNFGFEHYGFMVVLAFLCFYITSYVVFRDDWGLIPFVITVGMGGFLATGWPAFLTFWLFVMIALGPARFIFRWLEKQADVYLPRSDKKNTNRKVRL